VNFDELVEITNVYPGHLGGCIFKGLFQDIERSVGFRVKYRTVSRNPCVGEFWNVQGQWREHSDYGRQVEVNNAVISALPDDSYIVKFLSKHPKFRGFKFGESGAKKLVKDIGAPELVKLLNNGDWKIIADARITEEKSQRVCEAWLELKEETELATFLAENNLGSELAKKISRLCKFNTVKRLKSNPYSLVALSNSQSKTLTLISSVAKNLGISAEDDRALVGCVEFALYQDIQKGHTIISLTDATATITKNLKAISSKVTAEEAILKSLEVKAVCILEDKGETYLQTISLAYIEQYVEQRLTELHNMSIPDSLLTPHSEIPERLNQYNYEHKSKYKWGLVHKQCKAVEMALTHRFSLLSGYGGTGKTAVLKAIVDMSIEMGVKVHVAALAGKAANRAGQSIGRQTTTIHTMIQQLETGHKLKVNIHSDPLIIIDESSMVDISLICRLIKCFKDNPFRLLLVGDTAQLPPIGFGLFWHKLVESNAPHVKLTQVHRQIEGSQLHECAMKIRNGTPHNLPLYSGELEGVYLMPGVTDYTSAIVKSRKTFNCMVLTSYANKKFLSSTSVLNPSIQAVLNPIDKNETVMRYGVISLQADDPVIATKNAHDKGVFNGMTGKVVSVYSVDGGIHCDVQFDDANKVYSLSREDCWEIGLQLAYLITVHKSQGSEYDVCLILMDSPYLERSGIYTALTRTKKLCIIVGTNEQYNSAIRRRPSYETIRSGFSPVFKDI
jgi:exodeoxyribonuclease V alpha subunit